MEIPFRAACGVRRKSRVKKNRDALVWLPTRSCFAYRVAMDSYRTLDAWKLAHELCVLTLGGADDAWHPRCSELLHQLRKAVISVEANIVEGYALGTPGYRLKHYRIAFGSAAEAESPRRRSSATYPKRSSNRSHRSPSACYRCCAY
jgi:four helix bundle protein